MPFSSTSVEPDLQPVIELAFEAAWRELRLTPGRVLTSHQERSTRAELARRIMAVAAEGERDPLRLKLTALRTYRPGLPLGE
jgi:hypothetical protein